MKNEQEWKKHIITSTEGMTLKNVDKDPDNFIGVDINVTLPQEMVEEYNLSSYFVTVSLYHDEEDGTEGEEAIFVFNKDKDDEEDEGNTTNIRFTLQAKREFISFAREQVEKAS